MNSPMMERTTPAMAAGDFTELVRGNEKLLLERIMPEVRRQSVSLDLRAIKRIDAAGLTALIKLYCAAREAGHDFTVSNPSPHVAEILAVVGLDKILLVPNPGAPLRFDLGLEESAA